VTYCNLKSQQHGLTPCYNLSDWSCDFSANGYRLPTEAEWEYAARGGINWTDDYRYSGCHEESELGDYAWYYSNSSMQTHEVGTKLPNQLGIYDMSGNVYEWCNDWYDHAYYSISPASNPIGPVSSSYRVMRGGGWLNGASYSRVAYRLDYIPAYSDRSIGFRLVRSVE
jgi:formylglycine-generating enzyme required for sulfatase activity